MSDTPQHPRPLVWVVGDAMIDETLPAAATRFAQEDPAVPVLAVGEARRVQPGGAANVAANLVAMGCRARLFTSAHLDPDGLAVLRGLAEEYGFDLEVTTTRRPGRITTKTRVTIGGRLAARIDRDPVGPLDPARPPADPAEAPAALVFCDHAKGAVGTAEDMAAWAAAAGVTAAHVWLDPHPSRWAAYARLPPAFCTVVPNRDEMTVLTGELVDCSSESVIAWSVTKAYDAVASWAHSVCLKLGPYGSASWVRGRGAEYTPAVVPAAVYDLQGAGDTFLAATVAATVLNPGYGRYAALRANAAASVAVGRPGTAVVTAAESAAVIPAPRPVVSWHSVFSAGSSDVVTPNGAALDAVRTASRLGIPVLLTTGCFDLLGLHHIAMLRWCSSEFPHHFLVVGLNSDASISALKGPTRPVRISGYRAAMVESVGGVGAVVVFDEADPSELIKQIRPEVFVKGGDYAGKVMPERPAAGSVGARVVVAPTFPGASTTHTVERIASRGKTEGRPDRTDIRQA